MSTLALSLARPLAALAFCVLLATPAGTAAFTDAVLTAAHDFTDVVITPLVDDIGKSFTSHTTAGDTVETTTAPTKGDHR
jgi:hypothetical protein